MPSSAVITADAVQALKISRRRCQSSSMIAEKKTDDSARKKVTARYIGAVPMAAIWVSDRKPPVMKTSMKASKTPVVREIRRPRINQPPISSAMKTS